MGLSFSVLVALLLIMPGAAFVFGLSRLHSPTSPATTLDQHFSLGLVVSLISALIMHVLALLVLSVTLSDGTPQPDLQQVLALLAAEDNDPVAKAARISISENFTRIGFYFICTTLLAGFAGRVLNEVLPKRRNAHWYDLLKPKGWSFVVLTTDLHLDGACLLYSGVVSEFSIGKSGNLERVVLAYAAKKHLSASVVSKEESDARPQSLGHGWVEIPGELLVLQMAGAHTINCDYFLVDKDDVGTPSRWPRILLVAATAAILTVATALVYAGQGPSAAAILAVFSIVFAYYLLQEANKEEQVPDAPDSADSPDSQDSDH